MAKPKLDSMKRAAAPEGRDGASHNVSMMQARAFVTVARVSSFTQAARLLHLSQPALTVQVHQLEDSLNLRLFDRNTRHVMLTPQGRDLVPAFQGLLLEFEGIVENARDLAAKRQGVIRLACLPSVAATHLPWAIAKFREQYPHVSFIVKDASNRRIIQMIRDDEVEVGISDGEPNWPDLETTELYRDRIHIVFPTAHPIAILKEVTPCEVAKYPVVLLDTDSNSRTVLDAAFTAAGQLISPVCEVTYTGTAIGMVRAGLGITLLGSLVIEASNLRSFLELQFRPINDPTFVRHIALIQKKHCSLSPSTQAFADLLLDCSKSWPAQSPGL